MKAPASFLLAEAQFGDDGSVALDVLFVEVCELAAAMAHHFQESTSRVVVLSVDAQMLSEMVDSVGEHSNLNLGGSCVPLVLLMLCDNFGLALRCEHSALQALVSLSVFASPRV
jgi:hypothetical protein